MQKRRVKATAKGTVKTTEKGIKTAQATSKAAIKTTETSVKRQYSGKAFAKLPKRQHRRQSHRKGPPKQRKRRSEHHSCGQAIIAEQKPDFRFDCRWICSCDYSHCLSCSAVLFRLAAEREQRLHSLSVREVEA